MRTRRVRKLANPDSESLLARARLFDPVEVETHRHCVAAKCDEFADDLRRHRVRPVELDVPRRLVRPLEVASQRPRLLDRRPRICLAVRE
jgi:hypothetical protein